MKAAFHYFFFGVLLIPVLPVLYWQGRRVKKNVPSLPEARDPYGTTKPPIGPSDRKIRILLLGESTMAGVGVEHHSDGIAGSLARFLSSEYGVEVEWQVLAHNGYTARKVREELLPQYEGPAPDLIVVGVGGNDAFELNSPTTWKNSIQRLIQEIRLRYADAPILFASMPPIREFPAFSWLMKRILGGLVEILGTVLKKEVLNHPNVFFEQPNRVVVKEWLGRTDPPMSVEELFCDGVHPAPLAYKLWGESLGRFIASHQILEK